MERPGRVEQEQREEGEVEEVDGRRRGERVAQQVAAPDEASARDEVALLGLLGRRLDSPDAAEEKRRSDERDGVYQERSRSREELDEQAADAGPSDEGERAAAVGQLIGFDIALTRNERGEEGGIGDGEEHAERSGQERDRIQLLDREDVQRVGQGDGCERGGPPEVGGDHRLAPTTTPVDPGAEVEREHSDERERDQRDLVAEKRDRLPGPEAAERRVVAQQRRNEGTTGSTANFWE